MVPKWTNHCKHADSTFLGWVQSGTDVYDVYIFPTSWGEMDVCARFGNEPGDYVGIGTVTDLLRASYVAEEYRHIAQFLLSNGTVTYHPKEE